MKTGIYNLILAASIFLGVQSVRAAGKVEDHTFYSPALGREMTCRVYLPEQYDESKPENRFPVIYFLHGASSGYESYDALYPIIDNLIAFRLMKPVITVMPDGLAPPYNGSFYTNSELYGNFEDYIHLDLIRFIDSTFLTRNERSKRAIMGASMGAYGALKITLKHPELFIGVVGHSGPVNTEMLENFIPDLIREDGGSIPFHWSPGPGKSLTNLTYTMAGAFSPNLNEPFFVDFPLDSAAVPIPSVMARWRKENICEIARNYQPVGNLGINFDCGNADEFFLHFQNRALSDTLTKLGIPHQYEEYAGTHTSGLPVRVSLSLLYFDYLFQSDGILEIDPQSDKAWEVFPNPASDQLFVRASLPPSHPSSTLHLLNSQGQVLLTANIKDGETLVDLTNLSVGQYIYIIRSGEKVQTGKTLVLR